MPGIPVDLPAALDLAAFEHLDDGLFHPLGRLPAWAAIAARNEAAQNEIPKDASGKDSPYDLCDRFPLLEAFVSDCQATWKTGEPPELASDIWTEPDAQGGQEGGQESGELYLQAIAAASGGRRFLVLKSLPQALFTYQQLAHDFELAKESVEKLSRELVLKRLEAERATEAKSSFLAAMSHEIRTPLHAIIGMADVLSATALSAEQKKCVEVFQRNGVALLNLINDILDLSKVEAGRVDLECVEMDLRDVIARAMEVVEIRVKAKGLWLRSSIEPDVPCRVKGDPDRLRQVIINLLGNSIKFTDQGGLEVRVSNDRDDNRPGSLCFAIADTGIGIPANKLETIFDSFSQVDASTTRKYGGTGLGLAISKQLVELMGGSIHVKSKLGAGSTFSFTVKLAVMDDQSERVSALETARSSLSELKTLASGLHILLADDAEDNRLLMLAYMKGIRSTVDIAENGDVAVRKFRSGRYDIVLMDVEMPVMDGFAATRAIRDLEQKSGAAPTPVLALTAHAFADMARKGKEAGFTDILTKPLRNVTLLEALVKYGFHGRAAGLSRGPVAQFKPDELNPGNAQVEKEQEENEREPVKIRIQEGMEDVVPGYLAKRRAEIVLYNEAMNCGDLDTIRKLAHKMKGTGSGYGFPALTAFGADIERDAIQRDSPGLRIKIGKLKQYVDRIELEYS